MDAGEEATIDQLRMLLQDVGMNGRRAGIVEVGDVDPWRFLKSAELLGCGFQVFAMRYGVLYVFLEPFLETKFTTNSA